MTSDPVVPRLRAVTRPLDELPDLVRLADPANPLLWVRGRTGFVGRGETLRIEFRGRSRFADAAARWQELCAAAEVDDPVRRAGSGLVACAAFAFADRTAASSVMIVPRTLVASDGAAAWITEITVADDEHGPEPVSPPRLPDAAPPGPWGGTEFDPAAVAAYLDGVDEAVRRISAGAFEKVVLARQITGSLPAGDDLRVPLRRLADRYLDCRTFALDGMLGASPETLVRATGHRVSARVLAGTRRRHPENGDRDDRARDELLSSSKEQHEHAFAVQSVVTALAPHVTELQTSETPFALRLPNVWHLATDIRAENRDGASTLALVDALHPTAAVAGTPTEAAVDTIAELEPFDRERYSGTVGWIDAAGNGEWVLALRCAQVGAVDEGRRTVTATAGGGIVTGSDPERELRETVSKLRPVTEAFARDAAE